MNKQGNHVLWISTLKGISSIVIFIGHFLYVFSTGSVPWAQFTYNYLFPFMLNGVFIVSLFAIISGYFTKTAGNIKGVLLEILKRYLRFCLPLLCLTTAIYLTISSHIRKMLIMQLIYLGMIGYLQI